MAKKIWLYANTLLFSGLVAVVGTGVYVYRHDIIRSFERSSLPEAVEYYQGEATPTSPALYTQPLAERDTGELPKEINLAVPFTPQAPHANWDFPYKEFCEEASVLMAIRYIQQQSISSPEDADAALQKIKEFEENRFGYYEDTTAAQTASILTEYFEYANVEIVEDPTADDIRSILAQGKPVIMPAAGRLLGNPYFQTPGPLYHMLVIKGYTQDGRFITNDPGTRRGADFVYTQEQLMNAMHDWRSDENILQGRKVVLVVG